jgi:hypothetical protein
MISQSKIKRLKRRKGIKFEVVRYEKRCETIPYFYLKNKKPTL